MGRGVGLYTILSCKKQTPASPPQPLHTHLAAGSPAVKRHRVLFESRVLATFQEKKSTQMNTDHLQKHICSQHHALCFVFHFTNLDH